MNAAAILNAALSGVERALRVERPLSRPVSLDVILTRACNLRCTFCISYGSLKDERSLPFELYERVAAELFPWACDVSFCSGGEPFLYPRIRDALRLARRHRTRTIVVSNGMLIGPDAARWIVEDQALDELKISFDAATKSTLERIRRGADYETILGNLAALDRRKKEAGAAYPRIGLRFAVMRSNAAELPDVPELCARQGVGKLDVVYLNATEGMDAQESLYGHADLAASVFQKAVKRGRELGVAVHVPPLPVREEDSVRRCFKPWHFCQIDTDGSIRFCYKAWRQRLGFFQDGFAPVWRGEHYARIRRTLDSDDPYFPYCRYCAVRRGFGWEESHNQAAHADAYVIPGLEDLQVPFVPRAR